MNDWMKLLGVGVMAFVFGFVEIADQVAYGILAVTTLAIGLPNLL